MSIGWNEDKNEWLKENRQISFQEIEEIIMNNNQLGIIQHPSREGQKIYIVLYKEYTYCIPFVESEEGVFLKTIYKHGEIMKLYNRGELWKILDI